MSHARRPAAVIARGVALASAVVLPLAAGSAALGQQPAAAPAAAAGTLPGLVPNGGLPATNANSGVAAAAQGTHPLQPALDLAQQGLAKINANIRDYSCTIVKRERIDGKL
ncbi:MAG: hypothetical protein ACKOK8_15590, partial [Planctomycetia bacterium]